MYFLKEFYITLLNRVISTIIITSRNVTYALNLTPDSSDAYESSEKIWSMIEASEEAATLQGVGTNKKVEFNNVDTCCLVIPL